MADYQVNERALRAIEKQIAGVQDLERQYGFAADDDEDTEVIEDPEGLYGFHGGDEDDEPASLFDRRH